MTFLLFFGLFFPGLTLLFAWLSNSIPANNVPFFFDLIGATIFPRILIIYYIWYAELGTGWLIAHIIALIISKALDLSDDE